jgi:hypothetical protein
MSSHIVERMCPECRTTDANFPNIDGCKSCASMLSQEELIFWNTPLFMEPDLIFPSDVMRQVYIPWYINLIRMFMLE